MQHHRQKNKERRNIFKTSSPLAHFIEAFHKRAELIKPLRCFAAWWSVRVRCMVCCVSVCLCVSARHVVRWLGTGAFAATAQKAAALWSVGGGKAPVGREGPLGESVS